MNLNPMKLLKIKGDMEQFAKNHPKFTAFLNAVVQSGVEEGTMLEIKVTKPDGRVIESNLKLKESDLEMLKGLKDLM